MNEFSSSIYLSIYTSNQIGDTHIYDEEYGQELYTLGMQHFGHQFLQRIVLGSLTRVKLRVDMNFLQYLLRPDFE